MISIAVDFDGTLCEDKFPEIGEPRGFIIDLIKRAEKAGIRLVLWTCRCGKVLDEAVEWCTQKGLVFHAVNQNLPEVQKKWGGDTRKVMVDYYFDDKNLGVYAIDQLIEIVEQKEKGWI